MKLVQLVRRNGNIMYVNPEHVAYITPTRNDDVSLVYFVGLPAFTAARGTPAEIAEILESD